MKDLMTRKLLNRQKLDLTARIYSFQKAEIENESKLKSRSDLVKYYIGLTFSAKFKEVSHVTLF
jgi:hypothetical protein